MNFSIYLQALHKMSEPTKGKILCGTISSSFQVSCFNQECYRRLPRTVFVSVVKVETDMMSVLVSSLFAVYAAEAALKVIGLGLRKYFLSGWNM